MWSCDQLAGGQIAHPEWLFKFHPKIRMSMLINELVDSNKWLLFGHLNSNLLLKLVQIHCVPC